MNLEPYQFWTLVGLFGAFIFRDFIRTPKENHNDLAIRVSNLETNYTATAVEQAKGTKAIEGLAEAVRELRLEIREMRQAQHGGNAAG